MADLMAFASSRIWAAFPNVSVWDPDYIETHIKPLLSTKMSLYFSELTNNHLTRNIIRDEIIECIRLSRQGSRQYLIILDMHNPTSCNLKNLSEPLLNAFLESRRCSSSSTLEEILNGMILFIHSMIVLLVINCKAKNSKRLNPKQQGQVRALKAQFNIINVMTIYNNESKHYLKIIFVADFDLIMDWNCANVAKNQMFSKSSFNITDLFKSKFFYVLTREKREEFVEIFLCNGFQLHKFLTPSRMSRLFRFIHEDDFFHTICWETALGKSSNSRQGKFFIESDLNWLIEFCTGLANFVNTGIDKLNIYFCFDLICFCFVMVLEELHFNSLGVYTTDSLSAERKALTLLAIWAVMQNRYKLVEVLWKYCDHPVHLSLVISMFFERLSWHVMDTNLKAELKQRSKQFANYANGVLDKCYNDNISLAYNVLRESNKDWNYMTAVDIAANAHLKQFLAHPCCQKWLTSTFQGKIRLRDVAWGFFSIPVPIKILLCSFLIFPMYVWVRFKNENSSLHTTDRKETVEEELDVYEEMYNNIIIDYQRQTSKNESKDPVYTTKVSPKDNSTGFVNMAFENTESTKSKHPSVNHHRREVFVKRQPPLYEMIYMMWDSPITKFYTSQLFYMIFLVLISFTTIYPNCGNIILDSIICLWTFLIAISYIRHTYILVIKYSSISIYSKIIEIILILAFSSIFTVTRILKVYFYPLFGQKVMLALALLYFYYRLISIYLPISPTLGPFLYRFRLMITVDFVNYMRITLVILISNSIVLYALQHPYRDLTTDSVNSILHQGVLTLFNGPPSKICESKINLLNYNFHLSL